MQAPSPSPAPRSILVDMPRGSGPHPAVVLAPGVSYHLRMPLMERLGQVLPEQGIAVFRFNWRYMDSEPQGQPSDDLSVEQAELAAVIALARADVRVRPDRLVVAGKSMGSVVATRIFAADPALAGAVLLTPLISRPSAGDAEPINTADLHHGSLLSEQRPSLLVSGDRDPHCDTRQLHRFAAAATPAMRVAVVGGDHGFATPGLEGDAAIAARDRAHDLVARLVVDFVCSGFG